MPNRTRFFAPHAAAFLLAAAVACGACNKPAPSATVTDPKTEDEKTFYALGLQLGHSIEVFSLKPQELDMVKMGVTDAVTGQKSRVDADTYRPKVYEMARKRQEAKAGEEKKNGKAAVEKASKEAGAQLLPSGMVVKTLRPGTGNSPAAEDTVKVHYEGRLTNGTVFDSSYKRGQPTEFPLRGVVKCWTEGLQKMKLGEKAQLTCPSEMAYGDQGRPPSIPGGATLVFDVELLEIKKANPPPATLPGGAGGAAGAAAAAGGVAPHGPPMMHGAPPTMPAPKPKN